MSDRATRFMGGSPATVLLRLIILSLVVGVILSAIGITPFDVLERIRLIVERIYNMGFGAVEGLVRYFLVGAAIVFPLWLLMRLFSLGRRGG